VIPDNLKAAVLKVLVHDPILGEAYRRMALYYGFLVSPSIPYHPWHYPEVFIIPKNRKRTLNCGGF
jgi:hypothetical protein